MREGSVLPCGYQIPTTGLLGRVQPTAGTGAGPPAHLNVTSLASHHTAQGFIPGFIPGEQAWLLKALGAGWGRTQPLWGLCCCAQRAGKGQGLWLLTQSKSRGEKEVLHLKKAVQTLSPVSHVFKTELPSLLSLKTSSSPEHRKSPDSATLLHLSALFVFFFLSKMNQGAN